MDIHSVPGVKARDVAEAHRKDLLYQHEYGCNCMTYWIDEERENIFCLIEAGNRDAVKEMHSKAHGLVPHKIIEVSSSVVQSFLGRIYDPDDAIVENGMKVFANPGFRIILVSRTNDPVLLKRRMGIDNYLKLIGKINSLIRTNLAPYEGREVEHSGDGFIVSFESSTLALNCALAIHRQISAEDARHLDLRLALNGGEPIEESNNLFGDTIDFGQRLCGISGSHRIAISSNVKEMASSELQQSNNESLFSLPPADEDVFRQLYHTMESNFHDTAFDLPTLSGAIGMSQTRFYRKATSLTGQSFSALLKDYRLEKSRELMKRGLHSISQIAYDTGFSSPSYFTKCFKSGLGLLPVEYINLLRNS